MNPANWPLDGSDECFRNLLSKHVEGVEASKELGAAAYIFREYRGIFAINGFTNYGEIEDSTIRVLTKANELRAKESSLSRVDLYASVLRKKEIQENEPGGVLFFEIYLTQKVSNGVCESLGKLSNLVREGVRAKMGILSLEANLRLHFVSPLENAWLFFENIRQMWIQCGGQQATCSYGKKREKRKETVEPIGNDKVKSLTSKSLANKRKMSFRLDPLLIDSTNLKRVKS